MSKILHFLATTATAALLAAAFPAGAQSVPPPTAADREWRLLEVPMSDVKSFDLGSHGRGISKSVVMDKTGIVEVECAVHPDMKMIVEVRK